MVNPCLYGYNTCRANMPPFGSPTFHNQPIDGFVPSCSICPKYLIVFLLFLQIYLISVFSCCRMNSSVQCAFQSMQSRHTFLYTIIASVLILFLSSLLMVLVLSMNITAGEIKALMSGNHSFPLYERLS